MKLLLVFSYPSVLDIPDQQQRIEKYIKRLTGSKGDDEDAFGEDYDF